MALNDAGQVAGYSFGPGTFNTMSFIYDHGTITPISPAGVTSAGAVAMNAAGDVVGGSSAGVFVASHRNFPSVDISNSLTSGLTAAGVSDLLPSSALTATDLIAPLADASPGFGGAPGFAWNADTTGVMLPGAERFAATSTVF
jgi:hypothetical protein